MRMKKLEYTIRFITPAFLGNAEQNGQWRTPPFKALLRQWWRVAYAVTHGFSVDLDAMRHEEGKLFGNAWLTCREGHRVVTDYNRSLLRLRLSRWDEGEMKKARWPSDSSILHPEVRNPVGSALYLGYGPLVYDKQRRATMLKTNAAIQAGEHASLMIAYPDDVSSLLERALWLMDRYGTIGGRCRNGWGSFTIEPKDEASKKALEGHYVPLRRWVDCMNQDWPHAIGQDDQPLIWMTAQYDDWKAIMKCLAELKVGLRTQFTFTSGRNAQQVEDRHWLSYPVTNHSVNAWGGNARLPNTLRFKVRPTGNGKYLGVIFHVPHLPPSSFNPHPQALMRVWSRVIGFLDTPAQSLTRIPV